MRKVAILSILALTLWAGCSKKSHESGRSLEETSSVHGEAQVSAPAAAPHGSGMPAAGGGPTRPALTWTDPDGWQRLTAGSPMRKASYRVPSVEDDAEDAELLVFYFGPQGAGGVEANVKRWAGQLGDVPESEIKRSQRTVEGLIQHVVEIEKGRYSADMPMGSAKPPSSPKEGYGLLAAIVEHQAGPYFFKMTGPAKTVQANREAFLKLLDSVRPHRP